MANNLHRLVSGTYVAIPIKPSHPVAAANSPGPRSGQAVRWGSMVGIALTDEQFGYDGHSPSRAYSGFLINKPFDPIANKDYDNGETPCSFQMNEWRVPIHNSGAAAAGVHGGKVYYVDAAEGPAGDINYHLVMGPSGAKTAFAGLLRSDAIAADGVDKDAVLLLMPNGDPDLA